jgi:hypothetical protein
VYVDCVTSIGVVLPGAKEYTSALPPPPIERILPSRKMTEAAPAEEYEAAPVEEDDGRVLDDWDQVNDEVGALVTVTVMASFWPLAQWLPTAQAKYRVARPSGTV